MTGQPAIFIKYSVSFSTTAYYITTGFKSLYAIRLAQKSKLQSKMTDRHTFSSIYTKD